MVLAGTTLQEEVNGMSTACVAALTGAGVPLAMLLIARLRRQPILPVQLPKLGRRDVFCRRACAGDTLVKLLRKRGMAPDATLRVVTTDFPADKWGTRTGWYEFILDHLQGGGRVHAFGVLPKPLYRDFEVLCQNGMRVWAVPENEDEHYASVDRPRQLWYERDHRGFKAADCLYSDDPSPEAWDEVSVYFAGLERDLNQYRPLPTSDRLNG